MKNYPRKNKDYIVWALGIVLLIPIFFRISGSIYNDPVPLWDSGGVLSNLPLPVSILACFGGLIALLSNYKRAIQSVIIVASMLSMMLVALLLSGSIDAVPKRKVLLLFQFILPAFGLVLGQLVIDRDHIVSKAFLYVLLLIVPLQLLSGWLRGGLVLNQNLFLFSIYQHIQYVPIIFVCAFAFSLASLWDSHRKIFYFLTPLMFVYVVSSASFLAIFSYIIVILVFAYVKFSGSLNLKSLVRLFIFGVAVVGALIVGIQSYYQYLQARETTMPGIDVPVYLGKFDTLLHGGIPRNVEERFEIWNRYLSGFTDSLRAAIFGHATPFPREIWSSAHNWFLDMAYNFGIISLIPSFLLIGYTCYRLWHDRRTLPEQTLWLGAIVLFLVLVDNSFKVTLRQPYPGIFTYFLWGLLLSQIKRGDLEERGY